MILDGLARYKVTHLYVIGGDGSHRAAHRISMGALARKTPLAVAAIPKTIDNDIPIIDRSFGFETAVELAVHPVNCAHTEALAAHYGIGIVKVMGRSSGFIAMMASLASRDVNVCLLPECKFSCRLLCEFLVKRLQRSGHAVIVIAEGAGISQADMEECGAVVGDGAEAGGEPKRDESGNEVLGDVGAFLRTYIKWYMGRVGVDATIKYIDPSYMIRSAPANASDSLLCAELAFAAVHGAFAGYTCFTVGTVAGTTVWIPITSVAQTRPRSVDTSSRTFMRLLLSTGQPSFALKDKTRSDEVADLMDWAS